MVYFSSLEIVHTNKAWNGFKLFYEQCQLQNGLNSLWLQRLIVVAVKMLYHFQLELFFLVIQSLFGTPLRLKLDLNYTIMESAKFTVTIYFSTILETV